MKNREWLIKKRLDRKLTQQQIADDVEIDRSFYNQIENGVRNPSVETAKKIANCLDFDWAVFFEEKNRHNRQNYVG